MKPMAGEQHKHNPTEMLGSLMDNLKDSKKRALISLLVLSIFFSNNNTSFAAHIKDGDVPINQTEGEEEIEPQAEAAPEAPTDEESISIEPTPDRFLRDEDIQSLIDRMGLDVEVLAHPEWFDDLAYQQMLELPGGRTAIFSVVGSVSAFEAAGKIMYVPTAESAALLQEYFAHQLSVLEEIEGNLFVPSFNNIELSSSASARVDFVETDLSNIVFVLTPNYTDDMGYYVRDEYGPVGAWRVEKNSNGGLIIYMNIDHWGGLSTDEYDGAPLFAFLAQGLVPTGVIRQAAELQSGNTRDGEIDFEQIQIDFQEYYRGDNSAPWSITAKNESFLRDMAPKISATLEPMSD